MARIERFDRAATAPAPGLIRIMARTVTPGAQFLPHHGEVFFTRAWRFYAVDEETLGDLFNDPNIEYRRIREGTR